MVRGPSILSLRSRYIQLKMFTHEELIAMSESGKAKRNPDFALGIKKELEARTK